MMKNIIILTALVLLSLPLLAGEWTQYYFQFKVNDHSELSTLTKIISIDNVSGSLVRAYANDKEWEAFQRLGYEVEMLPSPASLIVPDMRGAGQTTRDWDYYPTYDAYVAMMYQFQADYPGLCQIIDAGTTVNGRKILFAKISDNITLHEAEPEVMYTSTMHGDETTGYILMLRLIDYLLTNYAVDTRVQGLVDNLEIWINPNANPDGTYYGGNSTVSGARRNNANGIDLNRSFPDPWGDPTQAHQIENTIMENLANAHHFALSANFHGGAEVFNYVWDSIEDLHVDNNWWVSLGTAWVALARTLNSSYMTSVTSSGITNGWDWYEVDGGRQDWMNFYRQCREATVEISNTKMPAASSLPTYWNYNFESLMTYLENALYGLQGVVTDVYGPPLGATVNIVGLDDATSKATTDPANGDYIRMLLPGTYTVQISVDGYDTQTFTGVVINANQKTVLNAVFGELPPGQSIELAAGWNLVSFNVQPSDLSVTGFLADIMGSVTQIKNQDVTCHPGLASHYNTMSGIDMESGYWINMSAPATLEIEGTAVDPAAHGIALEAGWNLVSYLPEDALSPAVALASVSSYLQEARSLTQTYVPGGGSNTLTQMEPDKGYWVKVSQPCTLTYPAARK